MTERNWHDATDHGLPHDPLKAIVTPRPIGWISTYASDGTANLAPYSFFNLVSDDPKLVMFGSSTAKDSARNAIERGAFAANFASYDHREAMNATSASLEAGESEFDRIGVGPAACRTIDAPMHPGVVAVLECVVTEHMVPKRTDGTDAAGVIVFGQVVGYHIDPAYLDDGLFVSARARPLARLGYFDYATVEETFAIRRPQ